jgi:hypothetical protein
MRTVGMLEEERQGRYFGLFETRRAAWQWLGWS